MPDPTPRRVRRWLRRLLGGAILALVAFVVLAVIAVQHLDWIAQWSIHRLFPGVKADLGSLHIISPTRLEVRQLTLKASKTGEPLLALEGGTVAFSFSNIWRLRLEEVQLEKPNLVISPDLGDALGVQPSQVNGQPVNAGNPLGWGIGHVAVNGGHLRITRFGEQSPTVDLEFSADFKDFGVGGDTGKIEHAAVLKKITATDQKNQEFLRVANVDVRFTTEELFAHDRIRAIRVGEGSLVVAQSLIDFFTPRSKSGTAVQPGPEKLGWSVGALKLDGLRVAAPDAPGAIGRVGFKIAADLRDLGAAGTPGAESMQRVTVTGIKFFTDNEPKIELLAAKRAEARFTVTGLLQRRLEELTLEDPVIDFAPAELPSASRPAATAAAAAKPAPTPGWIVTRVVCKYGTLRLRGLKGADVFTKFSFDLHHLGTLGDAAGATQEMTVWDLQVSSGREKAFLSVDAAQVRFTVAGLLERQRVDAIKVTGGRLLVGDAFQKLLATDSAPTPAPATPAAVSGPGWAIGALDISGVRVRLQDKRPGVPDVRFTLNTSLRDVTASGVSSQLFDQVQTIELADIDLNSPLKSTAKIFTLRSVFVRFTLRGLAGKHLREAIVRHPIIYLSQDLFVYMERAGASTEPAKSTPNVAAPVGPNWSVDRLEVKFGRLVIGSGGQKDVGVPIEFETTLNDVELDNLAKLKVQAALRVPKQDYENASYQLSLKQIEGDLRFAYPPEKGEKNLVQKLDIRSIRWRQYLSQKAWIAVTFDARGINGQFGGEAYRGYVNGGFSFNFRDDAPWQGWVSGTDVDTRTLTDVIAPENFSLTGPADFEVQIDAFRKNIRRMRGIFNVSQPGHLKIGKLDKVLADLPTGWAALKQSTARIALETLRDFDYTSAKGDFWFVESQGILGLNLTGPFGSRIFEIALHDDQETKNQWQLGTLGKR